ncbi:MAG: DUF2079 domain-containing protein [Ktedonobacteraceae bacterium]|nr:DUF2079 domain-containing protein [Ktedonobacteraceae bacterium]
MKKFDSRVQERVAWLLLAVIVIVYVVFISQQVLLRYDIFKATAFDLGNMDQVLWNTLHGRPFQFTNQGVDWYGPPTRLAIHFEPIILPLSLLYLFQPQPYILLVFQTLALALGAVPVFLIARRRVAEFPLFAVVMAAMYLLMPALLGINLFDFHPVSLATPLLLYAVLAIDCRRYMWGIVAVILAAACKEDVPMTVALLGLLLVWKYKLPPRLGTVLIVGGLLWSLLAFFVIIPHFYPGAQHNNYWYRYEALGSSPGAAIVNILLHPWLLFTTFITLDRFYYLVNLLRSTGFLALLAPEWLLPALPALAINLLSTDSLLYSGVFQYNATIIPFIMLASIEGTRRIIILWHIWRGDFTALLSTKNVIVQQKTLLARFMQGVSISLLHRFRCMTVTLAQAGNRQWQRFSDSMIPLAKSLGNARLQQVLYGWLLAMCIFNFVIMAPLLSAFWPDHPLGSREQHIEHLLAMIPPSASVSASSTLNPHLSQRLYITLFPEITFSSSVRQVNTVVQYIIVDLDSLFPEDRVKTTNELNQLVNSGQFRVLARAEGVVLLARAFHQRKLLSDEE